MSDKEKMMRDAFNDVMKCLQLSVRFLGLHNKRDLKKHLQMNKNKNEYEMLKMMVEDGVFDTLKK